MLSDISPYIRILRIKEASDGRTKLYSVGNFEQPNESVCERPHVLTTRLIATHELQGSHAKDIDERQKIALDEKIPGLFGRVRCTALSNLIEERAAHSVFIELSSLETCLQLLRYAAGRCDMIVVVYFDPSFPHQPVYSVCDSVFWNLETECRND